MKTGNIEVNLQTLNESAGLSFIDGLIERKLAGPEKGRLEQADLEFHEREYQRLVTELQTAATGTHLPENPSTKRELNDQLIRVRLAQA